MREKVSSTASDAMNAVTDFRRKAANKLEDSRQSAADTLEGTASSLHSGADRASSYASYLDRADSLKITFSGRPGF